MHPTATVWHVGWGAALGASNALLQRAAKGDFHVAVSTALTLEYADVLGCPGLLPTYSPDTVDAFLDSFCAVAREAFIYFRWRPFLSDPGDDLILECALAAEAIHIVTHNNRDFRGSDIFGISVLTPAQFLNVPRRHEHVDPFHSRLHPLLCGVAGPGGRCAR